MAYNYFELTVGRAPGAQRLLADQVYQALGPATVGVFAPLLGFASNQALVLTRADAEVKAVVGAAGVIGGLQSRLTPTLRPKDGAHPEPGGVYVHNWFTIDGAVDEFVRLSGEAWLDFETRFDAKIFGLFAAESTEADRHEGSRRLLLMTRYRDLGEWQKSRDPSSPARQIFNRRRELTRVSLARACVLLPMAAA